MYNYQGYFIFHTKIKKISFVSGVTMKEKTQQKGKHFSIK